MEVEEATPEHPDPSFSVGDWDDAIRAMEQATTLELPAVGYNRGGLLVEWNGQQGFVPVSHLADLSPYLDEREREQELHQRLGQVLCLRVIEVDPERSRLVLSERANCFDEACRRDLLESLRPDDICRGSVTNLCSFGAFVDLGGLEGLVHISEISWGRVEHPSEVLRPGQEVMVSVLNVDQERGRVGLSIKRTQPDPWRTVDERYQIGQVIEGVITNVVEFGAFAEVEEGVEGLIHVSELAEADATRPQSVVQEGQSLRLRVINVDGKRRRLGLSLRQVYRDLET
jgi:small subunit ribosomal protein S1